MCCLPIKIQTNLFALHHAGAAAELQPGAAAEPQPGAAAAAPLADEVPAL